MDVLLEIIIPNTSNATISGLERYQPVHFWAGTAYPQGPVVYRTGNHVVLELEQMTPALLRFLPPDYVGEDWMWLKVTSDILQACIGEERYNSVISKIKIMDILHEILLSSEKWVVIFAPHYDQIDEVLDMNSDRCLQKLSSHLIDPFGCGGFIIYNQLNKMRIDPTSS